MKKSWQQQGRCKVRFPAFVSVWFPWCTVQQTHGLVLAQKQEKVLMWLRSGNPSSNSRTFPTSQPVLLPCNPTSLSHASTPGALTCKTLFQRYHEERAVTPDLKWDSKEGELALSPAFPVCIGSEKNRNYFNKPYICENSHFPRGLSRKNKDGWLPGKVYRDFCMCFSNQPKRDDMDGCSKGCRMGAKQPWCLQPGHCALPGPEGQSASWAFWTEEAILFNTPLKLCYGSPVPATLEQFWGISH